MHNLLVIGAGKIGSLITYLLSESNQYFVYLADIQENNPHVAKLSSLKNFKYVQLDAQDSKTVTDFVNTHSIEAIVSSLPYYCNIPIAQVAAENNLHYFDLTEDVATTNAVEELARNSTKAFVPQCGLAPGFISIIAHDLMQHFPK